MAAAKDGELRQFHAKEAFLEMSLGQVIYIYYSRGISGVPEGMGLLNKIYGIRQAGRCLFNICCDDKFEQSEADRRVFCKFDDGEVEMVVFVHLDDILAHAQVAMERFAAKFRETFEVTSMVEKFGVEKTSRSPAFLGVSTFPPSG